MVANQCVKLLLLEQLEYTVISLLSQHGCHGYRYLIENMEWLEEQLGDDDDDYFLFDCPGEL